jgi:CDP-6-deoxy-D-xylo-4-hexulose-3-dehydrase
MANTFDSDIDKLAFKAYKEIHLLKSFIPGETVIPVTGKVFGVEELIAATKASLDFWLTSGPYTEKFEKEFAKLVGMREAFMVNSGSSANLLALTSLTSSKHGDKSLRAGGFR